MPPLQLFDYAYRQNVWLAQRQSVVSANVANANTPGYKTKDIESFDDVFSKSLSMSGTDPRHIASSTDNGAAAIRDNATPNAEVTESGNDVSLEQEFLKSGEITRQYTMNTQVMKAFNRMLQSVAKG